MSDVSQPPGYWRASDGKWYPPTYPKESSQTSGTAIAALVFAFLVWPVGIILAYVAQNRIRHTGEGGDGLARAALFIGYLLGGVTVSVAAFEIIGVHQQLGPGFNNVTALQDAVQQQTDANLKNPSSHAYSPGTSVTTSTCNYGGGTHFVCVVGLSNGKDQTLSITVSKDGSRWTAKK
jgi:hypothetical protein